MKRFAFVNQDGRVLYTSNLTYSQDYPQVGSTFNGLSVCEPPDSVADVDLIMNHVWSNGWHKRPDGLGQSYVFNQSTGQWFDPTPIGTLIEEKKNAINLEREARNELPITYLGSQFDADATAQRNVSAWMVNIAAGQNPPPGFVWRDFNNVDHPADGAFIVGLGNAITLRGSYLYQRSWVKKAEVDALTTVEAVKAYDVTTGW